MASVNSRNKGKRGEQEVVKILQSAFPQFEIKRNLREQADDGGMDVIGLRDFAIEVKNHANPTQGAISKWWDQTIDEACRSGCMPVLFYKIPKQGWRVVFSVIRMTEEFNGYKWSLTMSPEMFINMAHDYYVTGEMLVL